MRIEINPTNRPIGVIKIGFEGENLITNILFDLTAWQDEYGQGGVTLLVQRHGDKNAYPVALVLVNGKAEWQITQTDCEKEGRGAIQLVYTSGGYVKKSHVYITECKQSLDNSDTVPDPYDSWLATLTDLSALTTANAQSAAQSAAQAAESAQTASEKADSITGLTAQATTLPEGASATASYHDGVLTIGIPKGDTGLTGPQGERGEQGPKGDTGLTGPQGPKGDTGLTGPKGDTGEIGPKGDKGDKGDTGPEGPRGEQGPKGDKGDTGVVDASAIYPFLPTDTASGAIVSFTDGADNIPVKDLTVQIEPVQDLHGYDNPWPAGGGTNLLPFEDGLQEGWTNTLNGITATYSKGVMRVTGTSTSEGWTNIVFFQNIWAIEPFVFGPGEYVMAEHLAIYSKIDGGATVNKTNAFTVENELRVYGFYVAIAGGVTVDWTVPLMFVRGTVRPTSYSPYSNICPITGWTGCEAVVSPTLDAEDGETYSIDWTDEAGTVYGGSLTIAEDGSGQLVVNRAMVGLPSTLSWSTWGVNYKKSGITGFYIYRYNLPSTMDFSNIGMGVLTNLLPVEDFVWGGSAVGYLTNARGDTSSNWYEIVSIGNETAGILSTDTNAEAVEKFKAFLESTPLNVLFELATPITYTLTPMEIRTLLGQNNIWADTGDTTVEYRADTNLYVQRKIAEAISALS